MMVVSGTIYHSPEIAKSVSSRRDARARPFRKIARDINEEARDYARSLTGTPEFERSSNERKKVEMRFAHLKVQHRFERMRLRGLCGARDEVHLAAIVQNLMTLVNRLSQPPPNLAAAYSA
jgi:IS5 family transposase